jgi:hypothetical protein
MAGGTGRPAKRQFLPWSLPGTEVIAMSRNATWNLAKLRQHTGELVLLTGSDVAVSYELDTLSRACVTFFLPENGHFTPCASESGPVRTLVRLLNVFAGTVEPTQRLGGAVAGPHGPPSRFPRRIDPARRGVHRSVLLSPPPGGAGCGHTAPGRFLKDAADTRGAEAASRAHCGGIASRRYEDPRMDLGAVSGWKAVESYARSPLGA